MKNPIESMRGDDAEKKEVASYRKEVGINPLTAEAYFQDQAKIEKLFVRFEISLGEHQRNQQTLESLRQDLAETMIQQAKGQKSTRAVPRTPEQILTEIQQKEQKQQEPGLRSLEHAVNDFCEQYQLPARFDMSANAQTNWNRIREAYEAKMWRQTNNLPDEHTLGE